jgi:hypothetical protein
MQQIAHPKPQRKPPMPARILCPRCGQVHRSLIRIETHTAYYVCCRKVHKAKLETYREAAQ